MIEWSKSFKKYRIKVVERAGTPLRTCEQKTSVRGKDTSHVSSLVKGRNLSARKGAFCTKTSAIQELFQRMSPQYMLGKGALARVQGEQR